MEKVNRLSHKDLADFYKLYLYAFNGEDSEERQKFFNNRYDHSNKYGIFSGDKLSSGMLSIPFKVNFHGVQYKMNGIGDVMSYPEFGGHGAITSLMQTAFNDMLEDGVALSYLAPFSYDFYRRFGYEEVFDRAHYRIKNTDLPRVKLSEETGTIERMSIDDAIPFIKEIYSTNVASRNGGLIRSDWWWKYLVLKHPKWQVGIYFDDQHVSAGYLIYEADKSVFRVQEIMYTNRASYQYLARFICQHESMFEYFEYASGDPFGYPDLLQDPETVHVEIEPYMMARIVNLKTFVDSYPFLKKIKSMRIAVTDNMIPQNNGIWRLRVNINGTSFDKLNDNASNMADIRISIQVLTKVLMGYRSLEHMDRVGAIEGNFDTISELNDALRKEPPMLWDYF